MNSKIKLLTEAELKQVVKNSLARLDEEKAQKLTENKMGQFVLSHFPKTYHTIIAESEDKSPAVIGKMMNEGVDNEYKDALQQIKEVYQRKK